MLRRIFTFGILTAGLFVLSGCGQDTTGIPTGAGTGLENISNSALTGDLDAAEPAGRPIIDGEAEGRSERIAAYLGLSEEQPVGHQADQRNEPTRGAGSHSAK